VVVDGLAVYGLQAVESPPSVTLYIISMGGTTTPKVLSKTPLMKDHGWLEMVKVKTALYIIDSGMQLFVVDVADFARPKVAPSIGLERQGTFPIWDGKDRLYLHFFIDSDRVYRMDALDVSDPLRPKYAAHDLAPDLMQNTGNPGDPLYYSSSIDYDRGTTSLVVRDAALRPLTKEPYVLPEGGGSYFPYFRGAGGVVYGLSLAIGGDSSLVGTASFDTTDPARPRMTGWMNPAALQPGFTAWDLACAAGGVYVCLTDNGDPKHGRILKLKADAMQPPIVLGQADFTGSGPLVEGYRRPFLAVTPDRSFLYVILATGEVLLYKL